MSNSISQFILPESRFITRTMIPATAWACYKIPPNDLGLPANLRSPMGRRSTLKCMKSEVNLMVAYIAWLQAAFFENSGLIQVYCRTPNHRNVLGSRQRRPISRDASLRLNGTSLSRICFFNAWDFWNQRLTLLNLSLVVNTSALTSKQQIGYSFSCSKSDRDCKSDLRMGINSLMLNLDPADICKEKAWLFKASSALFVVALPMGMIHLAHLRFSSEKYSVMNFACSKCPFDRTQTLKSPPTSMKTSSSGIMDS